MRHLEKLEIKNLRENKLTRDELARIDMHLSECADCRDLSIADHGTAAAATGFIRMIRSTDHLTYGQLEAYVDKKLSATDNADILKHLDACDECSGEAAELAEFAIPPRPVIEGKKAGFGWFWGLFRAVPAFAAVLILAGAAGLIWLAVSRQDGQDVELAENTIPPVETGIQATVPRDEIAPPETPTIKTLAIELKDGGETIGINADGDLTGLDTFGAKDRLAAAETLKNGTVKVPDLGDLRGTSGKLMGNDTDAGTFKLYGPIGKVVNSTKPTLSWEKVPGVVSYSAEVFDPNFEIVASSGEIKANSWTPNLKRGVTYAWQVTAVADGKSLKAPQRPAPEAKFRVLDANAANEIAALRNKKPVSHLALGQAYARAGMLGEAIREFEQLAAQNPGKELPQKILRQLKRQNR